MHSQSIFITFKNHLINDVSKLSKSSTLDHGVQKFLLPYLINEESEKLKVKHFKANSEWIREGNKNLISDILSSIFLTLMQMKERDFCVEIKSWMWKRVEKGELRCLESGSKRIHFKNKYFPIKLTQRKLYFCRHSIHASLNLTIL